MEGIEPPLTVLETAALPLYYTGILVDNQGIEPRIPEVTDLQSAAVANAARCPSLSHRTGFEPVIYAVKGRCPRPLDERCFV